MLLVPVGYPYWPVCCLLAAFRFLLGWLRYAFGGSIESRRTWQSWSVSSEGTPDAAFVPQRLHSVSQRHHQVFPVVALGTPEGTVGILRVTTTRAFRDAYLVRRVPGVVKTKSAIVGTGEVHVTLSR